MNALFSEALVRSCIPTPEEIERAKLNGRKVETETADGRVIAYIYLGAIYITDVTIYPPKIKEMNMEKKISKMVDRFLCWKLPKDFAPDCGISFDSHNGQCVPVGTNLLTAAQAQQMFEHVTAEECSEGLQPHQQRVVTEKTELDSKATALSQFIGYSPIFETLDSAEQERLREQNDIMWQYSEILGARIAAFTE
jgi:hypothetical protein